MGDIYIAAHLRRCLRHSVFGHVLQYTPSTSVLDALHLHHAIKSPPLRYPSPLHITFIEVKNELVKMKDVFPMKVITHTVTHQVKSAGGQIESIMHPANFAGGRSRLDLLLPSFLPSREEKKKQEQKNRPLGSRGVLHTPHTDRVRIEKKKQEQKNRPLGSRAQKYTPHMDRVRTEKKKQDRIFCPLRGHAVGRMQYAPTSYRQETLFPINSRKERIETKIQEQKNRPLGSRGVLHTPHMDRVRIETKKQERIFCPLWGHSVGRMQYAPTSCQQETLFPINSRKERTETKIQDQKNRPLGCRAQKNTPPKDLGRDEKKIQDSIFCPLRGHSVGRMRYAPTSYRQEMLFPINSLEERTETKMQKQKNHPLGSRGVLHTPHMDRVRTETKIQDRIFCPLRGHSVGRMRYAPTTCRQETLFPINSREERTETKMQERRKQSIDSGAEWHTPFMRQGERDAVWRDTFLEQRARVAIWRDRRLEEKYSHASLQLSTFEENSKPYKSSLVALSEQLRDIFAA